MKTNYHGIKVSYLQDQTIGNCIDLGFGTEKIKFILNHMIENQIEYLGKSKLEAYR